MNVDRFTTSIRVRAEQSVLTVLHQSCFLSKTELKRVLNCGGVWLKRSGRKSRRVRRASLMLKPGDQLNIHYDRELLRRETIAPTCLVEKQNYSIWYKPAGLLSQGTKFGDHHSLLRFAEQKCVKSQTVYLVHRLDREAFGLMLLAHSKRSSAVLSAQFRAQTVTKIYWGQVQGRIEPLGRTWSIDDELDNKKSLTVVTNGVYQPDDNTTEITIELKSGRHHQIRRHLSGIDHAGD